MRHILVFLAFAIVINCQSVFGQNRSSSSIYIVYIDHENTTPVTKLCNTLKTLRDDVLESKVDGLLVYLANGRYPKISATNLPDFSTEQTSDDAFDDIIGSLQELPSHDVSPQTDVALFTSLMAQCGLLDDQQNLQYSSATLDFYVGPTFWGLRNNEMVIARLYCALDIPKVRKNNELYFNVYKPANTTLDYPNGQPFGIKNIQGINKDVRILDF